MTNNLMEIINKAPIDPNKVQRIEAKYECVLPEEIKHLLSCDETDRFDNGCRILSYEEVLDADLDLGIDFPSLKIVPIIDTYDNDFIAFDLMNKLWIKINIVDEVIFDRQPSLQELL